MALAKARNTPERHREPYGVGVKANTKIYQGSLVVLDAGYAAPGRAATGLIVLGRAVETVDNLGGAAGAKNIRVEPGVFRWKNSAAGDLIAVAERGTLAWIVDDETVAKTSGSASRSVAGTIMDVDASGVWVLSGIIPESAAALAAEIAAREAFATSLAAVTNGDGAALVGIEDAAGHTSATTVEGALTELLAGRIQKHSVAIGHADFDGLGGTDTSETISLGAPLPANSRILAVNIKLATPFTGGGNGVVTVDVGTAGDTDAVVDGADLFAAAVDGQASSAPAGIAPNKHFSLAPQLTGTFAADVGLAELTAGAATIEVIYHVLA